MHVRLRYFALVREVLGCAEEALEVDPGTRAADVLTRVVARDPRLERIRGSLRVAVNLTMAPGDQALQEGDEVAIFPPVMGGSGTSQPPHGSGEGDPPGDPGAGGSGADAAASASVLGPRFRVSATPLSLDEAYAQVAHPGAGAVVCFVGTVRNESEGRRVDRLEYEAYEEMGRRVLEEVGREIEAAGDGVRLCLLHRCGSLDVGERAVIIAASAPHRAPAFEACREAIESLKREMPVWKKEHGEGGATWLGAGL